MKRVFLILALTVVWTATYSQERVVIMSYNIRNSYAQDGENAWAKRKQATVRMIEEEKPVVVGMQELCPEQEAYLDTMLKGYGHVGVGREDGKREGEIMAVFYDTTKVGVERWGTFWLSEKPDEPTKGWDAACKRTCTWAVMTEKNSGKRFLFYNTHLDHVGKTAREMEVLQIADSVKAMSKRMGIEIVMMTGDFNTSALNRIFDPLKKVMKEAREESQKTDRGYTYNGFGKVNPNAEGHVLDSNGNTDNEVAIDHIFYKGEVKEFKVLRGDYGVPFVSDHFPVVGIFVL